MEAASRATWRGTIQFGLASIPVGLFTATRSHAVQTHSVHRDCGGRVRMQKTCELHPGSVLGSADIQRAAESGAVLPEESAESKRERVMQVRGFVGATDVSASMLGKAYNVAADQAGRKAYQLMRAAMVKSRTVALATIAFNGAESLAVLRPESDTLTLQLIAWPDETVPAPVSDAPPVRLSAAEMKAAGALIESMRVDLADMRDAENERLSAVVASLPAPTTPALSDAAAGPIDLMDALAASVKTAKRKKAAK